MSNSTVRTAAIFAASLCAVTALCALPSPTLAQTVASGFSPLSITFQSSSISSDFNNQTATLNNIAGYTADLGNPCSEDNIHSESCLQRFGASIVDDGNAGLAVKVHGAGDVGNELLEPGDLVYGDLPDYDNGSSSLALKKFLFFNGVWMPGIIPEMANSAGTSFRPTDSFSASVDFQVEKSANGTDSRQIIAIGSARMAVHQIEGGDYEISFFSPANAVTDPQDPFQINEHTVSYSGEFPQAQWFTYSVDYDKDSGSLTHTISSDNPAFTPVTHTETDIYPQLLSHPLGGAVDIVIYSSGDLYDSVLTLDNYNNTAVHGHYVTNLTPLTYNGVDYVGADATGGADITYFYNFIADGNGGYEPSWAWPVYADATTLPAAIDGTASINIALITHPNGNHQTIMSTSSEAVMTQAAATIGINIDTFYPNVLIAQGFSSDYLIAQTPPPPPAVGCNAANGNIDLLLLLLLIASITYFRHQRSISAKVNLSEEIGGFVI